MAIRRELELLLDRCLGNDPQAALFAVRRLGTEHLPWLEARAVAHARGRGWNWARIARVLGRTRQSVREKHRNAVPTAAPPLGPPDPALAWYRMHDDFRRMREFGSEEDQIAW